MFHIYQHFQDSKKIHQIDTDSDLLTIEDDSLYLYINNDSEYGLFEDLVESYHLDSQNKDDFQCDPDCYIQSSKSTKDDHLNICTHDYQHITQNINDLSDTTQQVKKVRYHLQTIQTCTAIIAFQLTPQTQKT